MKRPNKRIYLINRDFQMRYVFAAVVVGLLSTILTMILLLVPLFLFEILRIPRFLPLPIFGMMGLAAIVNIALVGLMGVFITHRIAGPMYSLVRSFRRIEMGKWAGHLKIRENDDLRFVVRNFNELVDGLVRTAKTDLKEIDTVLTQVKGSNPSEQASTVQLLETMKERFEGRLKVENEQGT